MGGVWVAFAAACGLHTGLLAAEGIALYLLRRPFGDLQREQLKN